MKDLAEVDDPKAEKILGVLDNLNPPGPGAFYEALAPAQAQRLAARFEFHYPPKQGRGLNRAEMALRALSRMGLDRRLPDQQTLARPVSAWERERKAHAITVEWRFTTDDARIKLKKLYPSRSL
jgi:hypothetical protein